MKISIITCTYNSEKYLQECIDSVISQKLDPESFEHIFIDWESSDSTPLIIDKYIKNFPSFNISFQKRDKRWIYNAFNEGIKIAKGEYIMLLNSDDLLTTNILKSYLSFIKKTWNKDFYYWKIKIFNQNTKKYRFPIGHLLYGLWLNKYLMGITPYASHPTVIEKKCVFEKYGYFNEDFKVVSDLSHFMDISNKVESMYFPKLVSIFRVHNGSASSWELSWIALWELNILFWKQFPYLWKKICYYINSFYFW